MNYKITRVYRLSHLSGTAQRLIEMQHYSGTCPRCAQLYVLQDEDTNVVGAAAITTGLPSMTHGFPPSSRVLSRFALIAGLPKNTASWFLSRLPSLVNAPAIITYADASRHKGTIYKAAGWTFLGPSSKTRQWELNGKLIDRKRGRLTRTSSQMRELGARQLPASTKLKFCWAKDTSFLPLSKDAAIAAVVEWAKLQPNLPLNIQHSLSFL